MMFPELPNPMIFAHRGASACAPENTLAAFELALRQEADGIEVDTKLSSDGQVVVIHDDTVDRTTTQHGRVRDFTAAELRQMDAGSHFDVAFRGEPIPTLDEVLKAVGQLTYTNIELKNYASITDELPEKVAALVKRHKLGRRVIFSSFNPIALLRIHRLLPEAPVGLLTMSGWKGAVARVIVSWVLPYQSLNPAYRDVTARLVNAAHERGQKVFTYTVNQEQDMQRLFEMGVDGIFTDDPALALQVVKAARGQLQ